MVGWVGGFYTETEIKGGDPNQSGQRMIKREKLREQQGPVQKPKFNCKPEAEGLDPGLDGQ